MTRGLALLHVACLLLCTQRMADEGHSLTAPDSEFGRTPLYYASLCGRLPTIQFLIDVCYKGLEVSIICTVRTNLL
jgi:Ankyrin repeat